MLSKVIIGDEEDNSNENEKIVDQQTSLWGASNGIEWQGKHSEAVERLFVVFLICNFRDGQVVIGDRVPPIVWTQALSFKKMLM